MFVSGCSGGGSGHGTAPAAGSPLPADSPAPSSPAASMTPESPVAVGQPPAGCSAAVLRAAARGPVGATAMMSLTIVIANTGTVPCRLPRPAGVVMVGNGGAEIASFDATAERLAPYLDLPPARAPQADEPSLPQGAAAIWLVWTWKADATGPCHPLEPPDTTFVVDFPGAGHLQARTDVRLGPCAPEQRIAGFEIVPG